MNDITLEDYANRHYPHPVGQVYGVRQRQVRRIVHTAYLNRERVERIPACATRTESAPLVVAFHRPYFFDR